VKQVGIMKHTKTSLLAMTVALWGSACDGSSGHGTVAGEARDGGPAVADGGRADPPRVDGGAVPDSGQVPPARVDGHAPCALSADCIAGQHCDLGECIQDCSVDAPCASGEACSPRGRCLAAGEKDVDPPPVVTRVGSVSVEAKTVILTERDDELLVHLTTDAKDPVRYRVVVAAPYLSIAEPRGELQGDTVLKLAVDPKRISGREMSGSVRIVTTLGDVMVSAPMKAGLTGRYQGSLTYGDGGDVHLGTTHLALDLAEKNGDVSLRIDPAESLLFPALGKDDAATGHGAFTYQGGMDVSLAQVLPAGFAGKDDPFGRAIGRKIHFHLTPSDRGGLDGTFEETLHGLFVQPVTLTGHAHFEQRRCADPADCEPSIDASGGEPDMPVVDGQAAPDVTQVFPGWTPKSCAWDPIRLVRPCEASTTDCAEAFDAAYHSPLTDRLSGKSLGQSSEPLGDVASDCTKELALTAPLAAGAVHCAQVAPLACALVAVGGDAMGKSAFDVFARLYAHTLDPALFVAEDEVVQAMKQSFATGPQAEGDTLAAARARVVPPLKWVLHPLLLESLRRVVLPKPRSGEPSSYAAARTLGRAFQLLSTLDAETARLAAGARVGDASARRLAAQERGLLTLLEAATLRGVADSWKSAPPELGTQFIDVLSPMDAGFAAMRQGALVFGVPDGFVPNVYEAGRKPTNFEQLLDMVDSRIQASTRDETAFTTANRQFEDSEEHLQVELEQVSAALDSQIEGACGDAFSLDSPDWSQCGAGNAGTVGAKALAIEQASEHLRAAQSAMQGKYSHIQIEKDRIDAVSGVRRSTIEFTSRTGEQLEALTLAEGMISAEEKALEIASQANVWNGGAPLGEAIGMMALEIARAGIQADRQQVQTLQDMRVQEDNAKVEVIDGMAVVKGLLVDMAQLEVEMREAQIGVSQARVDAENAFADAKRAFAERARTLARIGKSPLADPTFRVLQSRDALDAIASRADTQKSLLLAGRGLEYHLNQPLGDSLDKAVLGAWNAAEAAHLRDCLLDVFDQSRLTLPKAETYVAEVSVRKLLGIDGPRRDEVTGEDLSAGEQFRRVLLRNENLDGNGGVGIELSSTLDPGNRLWSSNVCDDRITQLEAQLVGDFLGDDQAEVYLDLEGGGVLRRCDEAGVMSWATSGHVVLEAGVNTFGPAPANDSLFGLPVASSKWRLVIPGAATAPSNSDLDVRKIDDVVLKIHHQARSIPATPEPVSFDCLASIGQSG
jgi:hypothetical protein